MTPRALMGWLGLALSLSLGGAACSRDPEDFCAAWVDETCKTLSTCCHGDREFDRAQCRMQYSEICQEMAQIERVHAGAAFFDSGAASACLGAIDSCTDSTAKPPADFEHARACANVATGFRPPGARCDSGFECERAGEYATCYHGHPLAGGGPGFCAKVVIDEAHCGFSFDTNELRVCPADRFCDLTEVDLLESTSVMERSYYYRAPCRPLLGVGQSCIDTRNDTDLLACKAGLYCEVTGADEGACQKRKTAGVPCSVDLEECAEGLLCLSDEVNGGHACKKPKPPIPFFCAPPCGDGKCLTGETPESCPEDCKGSN